MESENRDRRVSRRLSCTLDCLGYSKEMIYFRKDFYRKRVVYPTAQVNDCFYSVVGSRAEGISKPLESDYDILAITKDIICGEDLVADDTPFSMPKHAYLTIKKLSPGYYSLQPNRNMMNIFSDFIHYHDSSFCLSAGLFKKRIDGMMPDDINGYQQTIAGPAGNFVFGSLDQDLVQSIRCNCPCLLVEWMTRPRRNDWPPLNVRKKISQMSGNVVPVGFDKNTHLVWRMCFNEVELIISDCFNDTQTKLYKILKFVKNDVLKPKGFNVTSYIMKNIVFWLAEEYHQSLFRPDTLLSWIIKALKLLKRAVLRFNFPYYMIPGRNLLKEKIPEASKLFLVQEIQRLICQGPRLLLECQRIKLVAVFTSSELEAIRVDFDQIERTGFDQGLLLVDKIMASLRGKQNTGRELYRYSQQLGQYAALYLYN